MTDLLIIRTFQLAEDKAAQHGLQICLDLDEEHFSISGFQFKTLKDVSNFINGFDYSQTLSKREIK